MLDKRFTFLCNDNEREMLASLARHLERSQSDTVRWLIRGAFTQLDDERKKSTRIREVENVEE